MEISGAAAFKNAMRSAGARWEEGRFAIDPLAVAHAPKFELPAAARFFCMGSCFARNIEEALLYRGVDVLSKRFPCSKEEYPWRHNGIVNKFTSASMANEARWALSGGTGAASIIETATGAFDLQLTPGAPAVGVERAHERRRYIETEYFARLREADVVILTLGLIEAWRDQQTGQWQNAAPPYALVRDNPERFTLALTSASENRDALEDLRATVLSVASHAKFVVTVSPVPMGTTFSGEDIIIANMRSKSVLRAVAAEFAGAHADVDYFPSYEIVTGTSRAQAYGPDCIHVRDKLVRRVVEQFCTLYVPAAIEVTPPGFHEEFYLLANPDIEAAVRAGALASGVEHWVSHGVHEQRPLRPDLIPEGYYRTGAIE